MKGRWNVKLRHRGSAGQQWKQSKWSRMAPVSALPPLLFPPVLTGLPPGPAKIPSRSFPGAGRWPPSLLPGLTPGPTGGDEETRLPHWPSPGPSTGRPHALDPAGGKVWTKTERRQGVHAVVGGALHAAAVCVWPRQAQCNTAGPMVPAACLPMRWYLPR